MRWSYESIHRNGKRDTKTNVLRNVFPIRNIDVYHRPVYRDYELKTRKSSRRNNDALAHPLFLPQNGLNQIRKRYIRR